MSIIYFLNVNEGDCNIIQHDDSGHVTVIDICNGNDESTVLEFVNHRQKEHPVNPISYMKNLNISSVFRFILTHPDMDHMDGIKNLFDSFSVCNFWDTNNNKTMENGFLGKYNEEDWNFYQKIRRESSSPKVSHYLSGSRGRFYNLNEDGDSGGDGLYILCPTKDLVDKANKSREYNILSYVILFKNNGKKIIFAGDSGEESWDYIMREYRNEVSNIDVLIAPHHGRKTGGNGDYLDILRPKLTLMGNAKSKHLDYNAWNRRDLDHITNNEANCIIMKIGDDIDVYCTYEKFAREQNAYTWFSGSLNAWYIKTY